MGMKVVLSREYGFCHGVRVALKKLEEVIADNPERSIFSIGEIIHNKDVVSDYKKRGIEIAESIFDIGSGIGVVRAHGLPQSLIEEAKNRGLEVFDATCSYVRNISKIIEKELKDKTPVFLVGEPGHPEVIAATYDFSENVEIIDHKLFDPENFHYPSDKCAIVSQTTMSEKRFFEIVAHFIQKCNTIHVHNTICPSTRLRQSSAVETARNVDLMIILGGKNSSNTRRLYELCSEIVKSFHIERISEIDLSLFSNARSVGITAGASTPDWIVDEAINALHGI